jgi:hypothetical protein
MIPRWQILGCLVLVLIAAAAAVYGSPNSYAHAFFTGKCWKISSPACDPRWGRAHAPGWR